FCALATIACAQATLRIGDPIELRIGGVPAEEQAQVNNTYTVDTNGTVSLPYISKVHAEGLTPPQLARAIEQSYRASKIYTNPNINITMQPTARSQSSGECVRAPAGVLSTFRTRV